MEIQSSNSIQDTIHNLYTHSKQPDYQLSSLLQEAMTLVQLYNEYEITNPGLLSLTDYQLFLLSHLIVLDTNNARFLWKRIPRQLKDAKTKDNQPLIDLWEVGKALTKKQFQIAFSLIDTQTKAMQQDSEKNGSILKLLEVLVKVLREEHLIKMVKKAYATIEFEKLKQILGLDKESKKDVEAFLAKKGMRINGNFVNPPAEDSEKKRFELSEDRIEQLTKVVQFLEQQKHEFN